MFPVQLDMNYAFVPAKAADKNARAAAATSRVRPLRRFKTALVQACEC